MNSDRIREIQATTGYPDSVSIQQALLQVWNECEQEKPTSEPVKALDLLEVVPCFSNDPLKDICPYCKKNEKYIALKCCEQCSSDF